MIHVAIEYEAKEILSNLKHYFLDQNEDQSFLESALESIRKINSIMNRMPEKCDPFIYYNRVRPYIFGWKNNPATPQGVIYEEVDEYNGKPQLFRGETGAQSSIVPALDALLGITHSNDPLREYLDEMRLYMPIEHRYILNYLDEWSECACCCVPLLVHSVWFPAGFVRAVPSFRCPRLVSAWSYVLARSLSSLLFSFVVGSGGTPFLVCLVLLLRGSVPTSVFLSWATKRCPSRRGTRRFNTKRYNTIYRP
jgi:Indoleamine 2,3-dioxygenase.